MNNEPVYMNGEDAFVRYRLRTFLDEMFYKGGYMVMYFRKTVQTRNTDLLFVKVFCPDNERHSKEHTRHGPDQSENNSTK
mmetsp:Transcript_9144/g.9006  ORF Transcript_9144/g.9006 Transcript_9144/m.9006 type:complete len:80 (+) Transcript_9144:49-288(+)